MLVRRGELRWLGQSCFAKQRITKLLSRFDEIHCAAAPANFAVQAPVTESCLLGCMAQRMPGEKLVWNAAQNEGDE
jgi:hypothetical protein